MAHTRTSLVCRLYTTNDHLLYLGNIVNSSNLLKKHAGTRKCRLTAKFLAYEPFCIVCSIACLDNRHCTDTKFCYEPESMIADIRIHFQRGNIANIGLTSTSCVDIYSYQNCNCGLHIDFQIILLLQNCLAAKAASCEYFARHWHPLFMNSNIHINWDCKPLWLHNDSQITSKLRIAL